MAGHVYVERGERPSARHARRRAGCSARRSSPTRPAISASRKSSPARTGTRASARRSPSRACARRRRLHPRRRRRSTRGVEEFLRLLESKADARRHAARSTTARHRGRARRARAPREERDESALPRLGAVAPRARRQDSRAGASATSTLPNTAVEGNRELFKGFYPQANKDALIIDDRYNGGGFIPDRMIELLERPALNYWARRGIEAEFDARLRARRAEGDADQRLLRPRAATRCRTTSASAGSGRIIGTTTWGGLIGLSGNPQLMRRRQPDARPRSASSTSKASGRSKASALTPTSKWLTAPTRSRAAKTRRSKPPSTSLWKNCAATRPGGRRRRRRPSFDPKSQNRPR